MEIGHFYMATNRDRIMGMAVRQKRFSEKPNKNHYEHMMLDKLQLATTAGKLQKRTKIDINTVLTNLSINRYSSPFQCAGSLWPTILSDIK